MRSIFSPKPKPSSTRQRWLLLYNCQVMGLANSLNLASEHIDVEYHDPGSLRRNAKVIQRGLDAYERILVAPQLSKELDGRLIGHPAVWQVPTISFHAYHPDICYLVDGDASLKGPLGDYHSLIAFASFRNGLTAGQTLERYREETYSELGFFERWDTARKGLLDAFSSHGFDLSADFVRWSRNGPFMYSFNHPNIRCIHDVARAILRRAGIAETYRDWIPHDNLANAPIYPIYPEIGSRLGVTGSYHFKVGGEYRTIGLEEFVDESFRIYRQCKQARIRPEFSRVLDRAHSIIGAA